MRTPDRLALVVLACSIVLACQRQEAPAPPAEPAEPAATVVDDAALAAQDDGRNWLAFGHDYSEQRYSPLDQVNVDTVSRLGLAWSLLAMAVITVVYASLPDAALALAFAAVSIGIGTVFPVTTVAVQNAVERHEMGTTTALLSFSRQLGGALVVAAFGAILVAGGAGAGLLAEARTSAVAGSADLGEAFRWVFAAATVGLALSLLSLLFMEERPLRSAP